MDEKKSYIDFEKNFRDDDVYEELEEVEPRLNPLQMIKNVFVNPQKAFKNLANYPNYLVPVLIVLIGLPILAFLMIGKEQYIASATDVIRSMGETIPSRERLISQYYTSRLMAGVGPLITWLFKGFIITGIGSIQNGEVGKFRRTFGVLAYAYLPVFVSGILRTVIIVMSSATDVAFNLAMILPEYMQGTFFYHFASQMDIFVIWYQILAIIGISHMYKIEKKAAALPVLLSWGIFILIVSGANSLVAGLL